MRDADIRSGADGNRRLAVVAGYAPSLVNFRGDLLRALVARGWSVDAFAPDIDERTRKELHAIGIQAHEIRLARSGTNPIEDLVTTIDLTRAFRQGRFDAVFSYTMKPVLYASLAGRIAGVPRRVALVTGLGSLFNVRKGAFARIRDLGVRPFLRSATAVVFQNPDDRQVFESRGLVDVSATDQVAGSGVHLDRFPEEPIPAGPVRFLMVARLLVEKGVREYVAAARRLRDSGVNCRCELVGPVEDHPRAVSEAEARAWVDEGVIEWEGAVDDVRSKLRASSVYVLPSFYGEGTPRSILEALATGRPVITTDAPGCRETVIPGENGFLVPTRDVEALVEAMAGLARNPEDVKRMGAKSRALAEQRFDVELVNAKLIDILERSPRPRS